MIHNQKPSWFVKAMSILFNRNFSTKQEQQFLSFAGSFAKFLFIPCLHQLILSFFQRPDLVAYKIAEKLQEHVSHTFLVMVSIWNFASFHCFLLFILYSIFCFIHFLLKAKFKIQCPNITFIFYFRLITQRWELNVKTWPLRYHSDFERCLF